MRSDAASRETGFWGQQMSPLPLQQDRAAETSSRWGEGAGGAVSATNLLGEPFPLWAPGSCPQTTGLHKIRVCKLEALGPLLAQSLDFR